MPCERRTRVWRAGNLCDRDVPLSHLPTLLGEEDTLTWVDLLDPHADDVQELAAAIGLDRHTVEDALSERERPKAVRFHSYFFVTCFTVEGMAEDDDLHRLSIIVLPRAVVTVRLGANFPVDTVEETFGADDKLVRLGSKALLHTLLDTVVDGYYDVITRIDNKIDDLESTLFGQHHAGPAIARQAFTLHKAISRMRRVTLPMREVVATMLRRSGDEDGHHELLPYYEDLYDHTMRIAEWSESLRDTIESIQDTNLALGDAALNQIMKKLTSWAAIIAVPTAITGWYGQNVPYPGFSQEWGFWTSTGVILGIALLLYVAFKRRNWL